MIAMSLSELNNIVYYLVNPVIGFLTLAGLTGLWIYHKKTPSPRIIQKAIYLNIFFIIFKAIYSTSVNCWIWSQNPSTSHFLETKYIFKYSFNHYWFVPLITIFSALILLKLVSFINQKFDERFFYIEEPYLLALGVLLSPWPWLLFFVVNVILFLLIIQLINLAITFKNNKIKGATTQRIPMLFIWLPSALLSSFTHFAILFNAVPKEILFRYPLAKQIYDIFFIFK